MLVRSATLYVKHDDDKDNDETDEAGIMMPTLMMVIMMVKMVMMMVKMVMMAMLVSKHI